ncbi:Protein FMP52, mitochondrial [Nakaseomyces bracarensis]|uniref:Protein FMP52, mitochondrial n=1 Tax=Nakaseomyces bracarensis TaxID=273131 RepID=A0ABR4NSK5_9SACH
MATNNALVLGATGLTGSFFLKRAAVWEGINKVYSITRRKVPFEVKAEEIVEEDNSKWATLIPNDIQYLFTALATTRAAAGGFDKQYAIDHDLNIELAKEAKAKGCETIVVVSSAGANKCSWLPYLKMKGEIEEDLINLKFKNTIILRPSALLGHRENDHKGFGNNIFVAISNQFYRSRFQRVMAYPVQAHEVAEAGIQAAIEASKQTSDKPFVRFIESKEILDIAEQIKK